MTEPQLSVRSAKARDLAHCLARREKRSIADIVEQALKLNEVREAGVRRRLRSMRGCRRLAGPTSILNPSSARAAGPILVPTFDLPRHQPCRGNAAQGARSGSDRVAQPA